MMDEAKRSKILGMGAAVPDKVLTNFDLEQLVDTTDDWIRSRTGIERRHIAEDGTSTLTLATEAATNALADAGVEALDLAMILVGTLTPEIGFPATSCLLQEAIGAKNAAGLDISAACSGFIYGLHIADSLIRTGAHKHILVVGAETLSRIVNWKDRNTCVLFGDAAGAAVVGPSDDDTGILATFVRSDGADPETLWREGGGTRPVSEPARAFIQMSGQDVFKRAVKAMGDAAEKILDIAGFTGDDVDLLVPHQANTRIIEATAKRVSLPLEKVFVNIQEYGNTSAATIPLCLVEAKREGRIAPGQLVMLVAFGAGFTWGSALMRA